MTLFFWLIPILFLNPVVLLKYKKTKQKSLLISQIVFFIIGILYAFLLNYTFLIDKTWQAFLKYTIPTFVICYALSSLFLYDVKNKQQKNKSSKFTPIVVIVALFWIFTTFLYPFFIKKDLAKMANVKVIDNKMEDTNIEHIPIIPYSTAKYKGDKVLGKVKNYSLYKIGEYHVQKVGDELCWVAPLEFNGYFSYKKANTINYYVKVSAEVDKPAELVEMNGKYTPSAWFGNNLNRMVRKKYPNVIIMDASFEPDDDGKAYYAVSYGHYEKFRKAPLVDGVIVFDPSSGEMKKYSKENAPKFIDQVVPDDITVDYNTWYGKYKLGLINYLFSKQDVHIPTKWDGDKEVNGVFTNNDEFYYATDHTNLDKKSTTMVGFSMVSGRNGEFLYFPSIKGLNGKGALSVVEKTFKKDQWVGDGPVLYSIYGTNTWIIPVVDSNGVFREIALVNADTSKIAHAPTKKEAFDKYRGILATSNQGNINPTNESQLKSIKGKVMRVVNIQSEEGGIQKLLVEGSNQIFSINTDVVPYAVFTKEGDIVELKYIDTNDNISFIKEMKNLSLPIK